MFYPRLPQKKEQTLRTNEFARLFSKLDICTFDEQKQKFCKMKELIEEMDENEMKYALTEEVFNKIDCMIEEKKLPLESAIDFLKHIGYYEILRNISNTNYMTSSLRKKFDEILIEEEIKKEDRNEKTRSDLCECCILLNCLFLSESISNYVPNLLKATLNKVENEDAQKEVEIALLALNNIAYYYDIEKALYLNEIKEIMKYHMDHRNLTPLAYQSAWKFLIERVRKESSLEVIIANELHFGREASRELTELAKLLDAKRKSKTKGDMEGKVILRWLNTISFYFLNCKLWNKEHSVIVGSIASLYKSTKNYFEDIRMLCIRSFVSAAGNRVVKVRTLLKNGAVDVFLEEIHQSTLINNNFATSLEFFEDLCERLKEEMERKEDEIKRKETKRKVLEKLEEEGYEDIIVSFHKTHPFMTSGTQYMMKTKKTCDYFVHI